MKALRLLALGLAVLFLGDGAAHAQPVGQFPAYSTSAASGLERSVIISTRGIDLIAASGWNGAGTVRYVMFFNSATLPTNGTVPKEFYPVPAYSSWGMLGSTADWYPSGMVVACSYTPKILTAVINDECFFHVEARQ